MAQVVYEPVAVHLRKLRSDGSVDQLANWIKVSSPVDFSIDFEVEEPERKILRGGGEIKNVLLTDMELQGATVELRFATRDYEAIHVLFGSVGEVLYNESLSPPVPNGFILPTAEEMSSGYPFEMRLYEKIVEGSSVVGYRETHFYYCKPTTVTPSGDQQEYSLDSVSVSCTENPNYGDGKPLFQWDTVSSIP